MKRMTLLPLLLLLVPSLAVAQEATPETDGRVEVGLVHSDSDTGSSQFGEYEDLSNGLSVFDLGFAVYDPASGRYLDLDGENVGRDDQRLRLRTGQAGGWTLDLDWNEIPRHFGTGLMSPYSNLGNGLLELPGTVPITFKKLNTAAGDAASVLAMDELTAAYLGEFLHPVDAGTQRGHGTLGLSFQPFEGGEIDLAYTRDDKEGNKLSYGPIGDRPPRTLNVQFLEPIDYRTDDVALRFEFAGQGWLVNAGYQVSEFENAIDTLTWRNMFANPAPGADVDIWDRAVSVYGRRPLSPDNSFHNANLGFGIDTFWNGRFDVTAAFGTLEQDQELLPYMYGESVLAGRTPPRGSADAEMTTRNLTATWGFTPVPFLTAKAFFRSYDLDNDTPEDFWNTVTSDTTNTNGSTSYKNKRVSLAYAYGTTAFGLDTTLRLPAIRSNLDLLLSREEVDRDYREADTTEDELVLRFRSRPTDWLSLRFGATLADRSMDGYDPFVTRQSYWYAPGDAGTDNDNPAYTFSNHPDMVRYDISDRSREQFDLDVTATLGDDAILTLNTGWRSDDYDSGVDPIQPLLGTTLADAAAFTPGDQLGLLEDERWQVGLDASFVPSDRFDWNVFANYEQSQSLQRNLEFNENNKQNPSAVATAELGPWTRASSQWTADIDDETVVFGLGGRFALVPDKVAFRLDASHSRGRMDIDYSGFGTTNYNGTPFPDNHQFAFRTPPTIVHDNTVAEARLEIDVVSDVSIAFGYRYDDYEIEDWQQEANSERHESVGSEYLLRDSSRSHQWGNRLVNMGSYQAPGYLGNVAYVTVNYRF